MQIQVVSKGIDVSDALRERVSERLESAASKYAEQRPGEAIVVASREGGVFRVECSIHLPSGAFLQSSGQAGDAYSAADEALDHLETRMRRYKRKLVGHRAAARSDEAQLTVFEGRGDANDEELDGAAEAPPEPVVVAEMQAQLPNVTVSMAVLELDLTGAPVLMFRNVAHGGLNVVYRRPDGHVGWIDPQRLETS